MNGEYVIFRDHKAYLVNFEGEEEISAIEVDSLASHMQCGIKLDPGTLFDDVWSYIEKDWEFFDIAFSKSLGRYDLKLYVDQFKKPGRDKEDDDPDNSIHYLVITWYAEADSWEDEKTITWMAEFGGFGRHHDKDFAEEPHDANYGLDFTPINDMKGYELKLDESVIFRHDDFTKKSKKTIYETLFEGTRDYEVYDVINAILFEISWHGAPNSQMSFMANMDQVVAEAKDALDKGDKSKFVDLEDIDKEREDA